MIFPINQFFYLNLVPELVALTLFVFKHLNYKRDFSACKMFPRIKISGEMGVYKERLGFTKEQLVLKWDL